MKSLLQPVDDRAKVATLTDSQILAASIEKPALFSVLVNRWRSKLFARAARLVGSADDAEDVVQETLVRVYKYAHKYTQQEGIEFSAWVYAIFYNVAKTHLRRQRRGTLVNASALAAVEQGIVEFPDPIEQSLFERFLDVDEILSVLARLPAAGAQLLRLHVLEGKSSEELARAEGVSPGAIRVRLHRARQDFQETFQQVQVKTIEQK